MKVCIIKGNPLYINTPYAIQYYNDIKAFLKKNGVDNVIFDAGEDFTCPPPADFYIGHSKGVSRFRCVKNTNKENFFLKFGDLNGVIHPVDREYQTKRWFPGTTEQPPLEHFLFTTEQQTAILNMLKKVKNEVYQEDDSSTFESNGKIYNLNILFKLTHDKKVEMYPVSKLKWVLKYCKPDPERVIAADLSSLLLVGSLDGHDMTIDGLHRLTKAVANRVAHLPAKIVTSKMLEAALIKP